MTRFSAKWALVTLVVTIFSGLWYLSVLPGQSHGLVMGKSPTISAVLPWGAAGITLLMIIMLGAGIVRPALNLKPVACLAMVSALLIMGSFEWTREAARRPFVINEVMYSNGILKQDVEDLNQNGFLQKALWVENSELTEAYRIDAGHELFIHQCYGCHTVNGRNNDIAEATSNMSYRALTKYIQRIHEVRYFMPPFAGTAGESKALAAYIAGGLHGKDVVEAQEVAGGDTGMGLFEENCSSCHGAEELVAPLEGMDQEDIAVMLGTLNEISDEMEPFGGSQEEHAQLAGYLDKLKDGGE